MNWKKTGLLSISIALGSVTGLSTLGIEPVLAATATETVKVYNQFQQYVQKPTFLANARNYLINHIDEVDKWTATQMTLQLENTQKAHLSVYSEKVFPEKVQKEINNAFSKGKNLTYTSLLNTIKDSNVRNVLIEGRDKGYKLETSEGMYYPVMHYEGFKTFKPYVTKDIAAYIDIMATESNQPSVSDAAIVIPWAELTNRALAIEDFVTKYPASNRSTALQKELLIATSRLLYGSSNTPAYDYDEQVIKPEVKKAYEDALKDRKVDTRILSILEKLLQLLNSTNNKFTPVIEKFLVETVNS
ncbi:hypothetical protein [Paenibacillus etheri]|uniref:Uncharacterized protein n=1 Tax=Paenibacillus etheri TaxID=1306852 RepID=A0A0W1AXZ2_9BACL|nr:hypothetical protein [Paenibacillus etheri]KTD86116.1 hypothetical protein UQ64_16765 [Paenibacillus etheri]